MDSKHLFILLTFLLLLVCVLMDQDEAFELRPPRRRTRRCVRRMKRCSRRRIRRGKKADVIKPLDMNIVSKILVGDQCYNFQSIFKKLSVREHSELNKQNRKSLGRILEHRFSISFIHVGKRSLSFVSCYRCNDKGTYTVFCGSENGQLLSMNRFSKA